MMHLAMHDALNAVVRRFRPYAFDRRDPLADPLAAAAQAAHDVLQAHYPDQHGAIGEELAVWLSTVPDGPSRRRGIALGQEAARAVLALRRGDGWDAPGTYTFTTGAGQYQTTPPWDGFVLQPGFRDARPFGLLAADQFRPAPPPDLASAAYAEAFDEVKAYGRVESDARTADQTGYAVWWMELAEGSMNRLARDLVSARSPSLWRAARLFALLNMSLFDGYVACWDAKYHYNHWRPLTAIHAAAADGNRRTRADPGWEALRTTPPMPDFPSAHATVCNAALEILRDTFGDRTTFTMTSVTAPPQMPTRTFTRFSEAGAECAMSRVMIGYHFRYAADQGTTLGRRVARHLHARHLRPSPRAHDPGPPRPDPSEGRLEERVVEGRSLEGNRLGEETDRRVLVYLPPGYDARRPLRYPVVYLLAGLGGDHRNFAHDGTPNRIGRLRSPATTVGLDVKRTADALIASGEMPPAILVGVSGLNTYANHWFACSSVIGDHRAWVASDIVRFVDREYRTRPDRRHRAILGHSSGGFGALSLALEYPDVFGGVGLLSPAGNDFAATAPGSPLPRLFELFFLANPTSPGRPTTTPVDEAIPSDTFAALWGATPGGGSFVTNVVYSLSAAFSPKPRGRPFPLDLPVVYPQKAIVPEVVMRWLDDDLVSQVEAAAGNLARTPVYLARGLGPTVLHPEVGDILRLRDAFVAHGVAHTVDELPGDHFTALPQALRNALVFLLDRLGSQDDAPLTPTDVLRDRHRECRRHLQGREAM
jgi:pimeloyl-ACP methyl ester carboxylesterase